MSTPWTEECWEEPDVTLQYPIMERACACASRSDDRSSVASRVRSTVQSVQWSSERAERQRTAGEKERERESGGGRGSDSYTNNGKPNLKVGLSRINKERRAAASIATDGPLSTGRHTLYTLLIAYRL